jgi:multidrug efflux system membrane fusion protein
MRTIPRFVSLSSLALLLSGAGAGCKPNSGSAGGAPPGGRPATLVVAADVSLRDVPVYLDEIGACVAREMVSIQSQVSGKIQDIHFADGADLKKGDKLFTIDPRPYEAALAGTEAQYEKDKALAANGRSSAQRQQKLFEQKLISPADYDTARYSADAQDATVKSDAAAVQTAKLNLEYCTILAPIDGRAGRRLVDVGNVLRSDTDTSLLTIQRIDPIYVDFTATEADLPAIRENMADGSLKVLARIPANSAGPTTSPATSPTTSPATPPSAGEVSREGSLTFLDNAVADGTGTIKLRATIQNADHVFWPGQFVHVRLILKTLKNVAVISGDALQLSQQGTFVYVIGADNTVQPQPVVVGQRQGDAGEMVAISSGLKGGEKIVVTGQLTLGPGAPVRMAEPATQPIAAAAGAK